MHGSDLAAIVRSGAVPQEEVAAMLDMIGRELGKTPARRLLSYLLVRLGNGWGGLQHRTRRRGSHQHRSCMDAVTLQQAQQQATGSPALPNARLQMRCT